MSARGISRLNVIDLAVGTGSSRRAARVLLRDQRIGRPGPCRKSSIELEYAAERRRRSATRRLKPVANAGMTVEDSRSDPSVTVFRRDRGGGTAGDRRASSADRALDLSPEALTRQGLTGRLRARRAPRRGRAWWSSPRARRPWHRDSRRPGQSPGPGRFVRAARACAGLRARGVRAPSWRPRRPAFETHERLGHSGPPCGAFVHPAPRPDQARAGSLLYPRRGSWGRRPHAPGALRDPPEAAVEGSERGTD